MDQPRFDKPFDPHGVEKKWYNFWEEKGFFHADGTHSDSKPFCIVIPPPNITGSLHMGHALNNTLQDVLVRWKRMQGKVALWMPGTDHAGIATQNVVERQLMTSGTNRQTLGRENFIDRVWKWRKESGRSIISQLKRLGASCDWSRERFTMDEGLSVAVREVFVRLYDEGLIYRGERLINWCPRCETALSDIEVDHEETKGKIYDIRYPIADEADLYLVVSTTRPETMLGDTAVAVHPEDPRYNHLIGKFIELPLTTRKIPIVGDSILVDREFGTGAVKITPAHDFNDEKAGQRHGLPKISILDKKAQIKPLPDDVDQEVRSDLLMLGISKARTHVADWLENKGFLVKVEDHRHSIGRCYRCKTVVEPYLSAQWFVKVNEADNSLVAPAIEAVRTGKVRIIPEGWRNNYFGWMENIQDWCISRQIWWGHRIPAWYCKDCNLDSLLHSDLDGTPLIGMKAKPFVSRLMPGNCPVCKGTKWVQDPDVLDTWFSSALWPFSTLGWPEETADLKFFYPTSTLVTSFDILFFWVARMIMMGLKFRGEVPFREVYIHALVRDAEGQKMSKSKGNVVDPLGVMEQVGTDALRFTLCSMASPGRDIKLSTERIEGNRNFANKIWNAARFIHLQLGNSRVPSSLTGSGQDETETMVDLWIKHRLSAAVRATNEGLDQYRFDEASRVLYQFTWHEFCDWYLELIKPILADSDHPHREGTITRLVRNFETLLRLLHPFMPFITEEIWQSFPKDPASPSSIMVAQYPGESKEGRIDNRATTTVEMMIDLVRAIRAVRMELGISPALPLQLVLRPNSKEQLDLLNQSNQIQQIKTLGRLSALVIGLEEVRPRGSVLIEARLINQAWLELEGAVDPAKEKKRMGLQMNKLQREVDQLEKKLGNEGFRLRAPEVWASERERLDDLKSRQVRLKEQLAGIEELA